jgi:hypothetical protein
MKGLPNGEMEFVWKQFPVFEDGKYESPCARISTLVNLGRNVPKSQQHKKLNKKNFSYNNYGDTMCLTRAFWSDVLIHSG